jgi:cbb3-type cytochrome oxidase maturation protein
MSLGLLILLSLALGLVAWGFFVWSVRSGQYDDPEGPKYRMMEEEGDEEAVPPGRGDARRKDGSPHRACTPLSSGRPRGSKTPGDRAGG